MTRSAVQVIAPEAARRLFIVKQRLAGPRPAADAAGILQTVRELGCLQLDPISVVDRTHRLVLWSRVGRFEQSELDRLMWQQRALFEYWAHCASIVLTEDFPIHNLTMRRYPRGEGAWVTRIRDFMSRNRKLQRYILERLRRDGPLASRAFTAEAGLPDASPLHPSLEWESGGWTAGRSIGRMLDFLWLQGKVMVAGRSGGQKLWDLAERCIPEWTPRDRLPPAEVSRRAAERAVLALGIATERHIQRHFIRDRYHDLPGVLAGLERAGRIARVGIDGWPGTWYVHVDDLPLLDRLDDEWSPRTVLLSPFDNLICDRARTRRFFDFDYTIEIYTPPAKRRYGYYVLPILHGDRLIGRLDPVMNREDSRLEINAVYAEPGAPKSAGRAIAATVEDLAAFLGARDITYARRRLPAPWKAALR